MHKFQMGLFEYLHVSSEWCSPVGEFLCCGSFSLADNPELDLSQYFGCCESLGLWWKLILRQELFPYCSNRSNGDVSTCRSVF